MENGGKDTYGYEIVAVNNRKEAKLLRIYLNMILYLELMPEMCKLYDKDKLVIDGHEILLFEERDPATAPWKQLGVDIVIESTGKFNNKADAEKHTLRQEQKVILTAPWVKM